MSGSQTTLLDKLSHFGLRLCAFYWLAPRLRSGRWRISARAVERLRPTVPELSGVYDSAQEFFRDEVGMCQTCHVGCCGGAFDRFCVYDHISQVIAGNPNPPLWGYRLHLVHSYQKNRVREGWCRHYDPARGCVLNYRLRPSMCVWFSCSRMREILDADKLDAVRRLRRRFDRVQWRYARVLIFGGLERAPVPPGTEEGLSGLIRRASRAAGDAVDLIRERGWRIGLRYMARRLWRVSRTFILERPAARSGGAAIPPGTRIVKLDAKNWQPRAQDLRAVEVGTDLRYFRAGAWCYLVYRDETPVAVGWAFPESSLLRRLGYPAWAIYVGGFAVRQEFRGQGIYGVLLDHMCRDAAGTWGVVVAQASVANEASLQGLAKAGFIRVGRLTATVFAGMMPYCRLEPVP